VISELLNSHPVVKALAYQHHERVRWRQITAPRLGRR
jgi:hypothetical protein